MQSKVDEIELPGFTFVFLLAGHAHILAESLFPEKTEIPVVAKDAYVTSVLSQPSYLCAVGLFAEKLKKILRDGSLEIRCIKTY